MEALGNELVELTYFLSVENDNTRLLISDKTIDGIMYNAKNLIHKNNLYMKDFEIFFD